LKKLFLFMALPVLMLAGNINYVLHSEPADVRVRRSFGFDVVELTGGSNAGQPGYPSLPRRTLTLLLPSDARVTGVKVVPKSSVVLPGSFRLFPAQPPRTLNEPAMTAREMVAPVQLTGVYPAQALAHYSVGVKSNYRLCAVTCNPLQYDPANGQLTLYTELQVAVEYATDNPRLALTLTQREQFSRDIAALVANPEELDRFAPSLRAVDDYAVDYLVITGEPMLAALQPFVDWKTDKGFRTEVRTVTWVKAQYPGRDVPEKMRNAVIDYYTNRGLRYLLLAGDVAVVPCRRARAIVGSEVGNIPCDLYFADLQGSWDENQNDIFGESGGDEVDLYADIYVGRASIENSDEATTFVRKVLAYEQQPDAGYLQKTLLPSGWLWQSMNYHGRRVNDAIAELSPSGWQDASLIDPASSLISRDSINAGFAFAHPAGHGNEQGVYSENGTAIYTVAQAQSQNNGLNKLCIMNSMACDPGNFEYSDCLAEVLMNNPNGGAVGVMMNSRYGWGTPPSMGPSEELDVGFYDFQFNYDSTDLGITHARGLDYFHDYAVWDDCWRWCVYELNLLGDPQLPVWLGPPQTMQVTCTDTIRTGPDTIQALVQVGGAPLAQARVCARKGTEVLVTGLTNSSGRLDLATVAAVPGELKLTVSAPGCLPVQRLVVVIPGEPLAYLGYDSYAIDDAGQVNPNQCFDPGETDNIRVTVRNLGNRDATNVSARLVALNSYVLIPDSLSDYGTVTAGGSGSGDGFTISARPGIPSNCLLEFSLEVTANEGNWSLPFQVYVGFPGLSVANVDSCAALLSVTAAGALGYDRQPSTQGRGFRYLQRDTSRLYLGSFLFGTGADYVVDNYYGQPAANLNHDWRMTDSLRYVIPLWGGSQQVRGGYSDAGMATPRSLQVRQNAFAVKRDGYDDFVILVYDITNAGANHMPQSYAGLVCDFDVVPTDRLHDLGATDARTRSAYMWNALTTNPTVGVCLLSADRLANATLLDPLLYKYADSALTEGMKFRILNGGINLPGASRCGDWQLAVSAGPIELCPGLTRRVAFALVGGSDSTSFLANCDSARSWYDRCVGLAEARPARAVRPQTWIQVSPNPCADLMHISFEAPRCGDARIALFDAAGRKAADIPVSFSPGVQTAVVSWRSADLAPGVYFLKLQTSEGTAVSRVLLAR
jgi:hypothetical protein